MIPGLWMLSGRRSIGTSNTHREYPRSYGHLGYNYDLVIGGTLSSSKQAKRPAQERGMKRKEQLQDK